MSYTSDRERTTVDDCLPTWRRKLAEYSERPCLYAVQAPDAYPHLAEYMHSARGRDMYALVDDYVYVFVEGQGVWVPSFDPSSIDGDHPDHPVGRLYPAGFERTPPRCEALYDAGIDLHDYQAGPTRSLDTGVKLLVGHDVVSDGTLYVGCDIDPDVVDAALIMACFIEGDPWHELARRRYDLTRELALKVAVTELLCDGECDRPELREILVNERVRLKNPSLPSVSTPATAAAHAASVAEQASTSHGIEAHSAHGRRQ